MASSITIRKADISTDGHTRSLRHWGGLAAAKRYAGQHGHAFVLRATGRGTLFFRDGDKVRQHSWDAAVAR